MEKVPWRDPSCPKYDECLMEAARANVGFNCNLCEGKGIKCPIPKPKVTEVKVEEVKPMEGKENAVVDGVKKGKKCKQCQGTLPNGRRKFCSNGCSEKFHSSRRPVGEGAGMVAEQATPEELVMMIERGVVIKVINLLKKEFGV